MRRIIAGLLGLTLVAGFGPGGARGRGGAGTEPGGVGLVGT
jgi:hypothetical protein